MCFALAQFVRFVSDRASGEQIDYPMPPETDHSHSLDGANHRQTLCAPLRIRRHHTVQTDGSWSNPQWIHDIIQESNVHRWFQWRWFLTGFEFIISKAINTGQR